MERNEISLEVDLKQIALQSFFDSDKEANIDWEDYFNLSAKNLTSYENPNASLTNNN
jgi:hypothetical protein